MSFAGKLVLTFIAIAVAGALSVAVAQADPGSSPKSETIQLDCQNLGTFTIWAPMTSENANENAPAWGVGHVVDSNQIFVPFGFEFEFDGMTFDLAKGHGNAIPPSGTFDTCTFTEDGFSGTVYALLPQPQ